MANFDANEIKRQARRVGEQTLVFSTKVKEIMDNLNSIKVLIDSPDNKNLYNEIQKIIEAYRVLENKTSLNFKNLASLMESYANKAMNITESATQEVKSSSTNLDNIIGTLDSVSSIPEFYVDFE